MWETDIISLSTINGKDKYLWVLWQKDERFCVTCRKYGKFFYMDSLLTGWATLRTDSLYMRPLCKSHEIHAAQSATFSTRILYDEFAP